MSQLGNAIALAAFAHRNQLDKAGQPYILHPLAVMHAVAAYGETYQIVAVLHDVVEDTPVPLETIERRFGAGVADAVDALSRRKNESYKQFIQRAKLNEIAKAVKQADIHHNLFGRPPRDGMEKLRAKYWKALEELKAA